MNTQTEYAAIDKLRDMVHFLDGHSECFLQRFKSIRDLEKYVRFCESNEYNNEYGETDFSKLNKYMGYPVVIK